MSNKQPTHISIRPTAIFLEQLTALCKRLGDNKARVIMRAIAEAYEKYCKPT